MRLSDLLSPTRIFVHSTSDSSMSKALAIGRLADMFAGSVGGVGRDEIERVLLEREELQSTGVGEGVVIPHAAHAALTDQMAAILLVPGGVAFDAIDGASVRIIFGVLGPKRATGEHLKTLARVSRLLRNKDFRSELLASPTAPQVLALFEREELVVTKDEHSRRPPSS